MPLKFLLISVMLTVALTGCGGPSPDATYPVAAQGIQTGALSATSDLALIGSLNHGASLWRTGVHTRLFEWNHHPGAPTQLVAGAFSPDGARAVTTDPRTLAVWDTATGAALAYWATPGSTRDVAISNDGRVLMGLTDHSAVLFDAGTGAHLHTFLHQGVVGSVALSADGRWALTGSDDASAVLWNTRTGDAVHRFETDNPVRVVALSRRGRYAFAASQGRRVVVYDGSDGKPALLVAERNRGVTSAAFSADERYLMIGYVNRAVELWDVTTRRLLQRWHVGARNPWRPSGSAVVAVGFSPSPSRFYALAGDGRLLELGRG